ERPVLGTGPDTFQLVFGRHRGVAQMLSEWDTTPTRAHNEPIHILATQGIVGIVAIALLLAGLVQAGLRAWRQGPAEDRGLIAALAAGLAGFGVHSLFSFTVLGYGTLFVTLAA